ncbi:MAG: hypothetical protein AAF196_00175 [Planctomycetota bacterium]
MFPHVACLALSLLPQIQEAAPAPRFVNLSNSLRVVCAVGVLRPGGLDPRALGLGDGGFSTEQVQAEPESESEEAGIYADGAITPGGARLRVQLEGVKVDLPNGRELLVDRRCRVHLRDGNYSEPAPRGIVLWFGDGSLLECQPGDHSLRSVRFFEWAGGQPEILWAQGRQRRRDRRSPEPSGRCLAVLGDGRSLYDLVCFGPVVAAKRALTPRLDPEQDIDPADLPPAAAAILLGDLLRGSLGQLPTHARRAAAGRAQVHQRCDALAGVAGRLFYETRTRDIEIGDECSIALGQSLRLRIEARERGRVSIEMWNTEGVAVAQWIHTNRTMLHLLEKDGEGRNHYVMPALTLDRRFWNVLPVPNSPAILGDARSLLIGRPRPETLERGR